MCVCLFAGKKESGRLPICDCGRQSEVCQKRKRMRERDRQTKPLSTFQMICRCRRRRRGPIVLLLVVIVARCDGGCESAADEVSAAVAAQTEAGIGASRQQGWLADV